MNPAKVVPLKRGRLLRAERRKVEARDHAAHRRPTAERNMAKYDHFSIFVAGLLGGVVGGLAVALTVAHL